MSNEKNKTGDLIPCLLYPDNAAYLRNRRESITSKFEVLANIDSSENTRYKHLGDIFRFAFLSVFMILASFAGITSGQHLIMSIEQKAFGMILLSGFAFLMTFLYLLPMTYIMLLGFIYSTYRLFDYSQGSYAQLKNLGKVYTGKVISVEAADTQRLIQYEVIIKERNQQKEKVILNYTTSSKLDINPNDFCVVLCWDNNLYCLL